MEQEDAEASRRLKDVYFSRVTVVLFCEIAPLSCGSHGKSSRLQSQCHSGCC